MGLPEHDVRLGDRRQGVPCAGVRRPPPPRRAEHPGPYSSARGCRRSGVRARATCSATSPLPLPVCSLFISFLSSRQLAVPPAVSVQCPPGKSPSGEGFLIQLGKGIYNLPFISFVSVLCPSRTCGLGSLAPPFRLSVHLFVPRSSSHSPSPVNDPPSTTPWQIFSLILPQFLDKAADAQTALHAMKRGRTNGPPIRVRCALLRTLVPQELSTAFKLHWSSKLALLRTTPRKSLRLAGRQAAREL